jgi:hypothetical protein
MRFARTYTHLGPESISETICKARRCIHITPRRIYCAHELLGVRGVFSNNGVRVLGGMLVDV